MASMLCFREGCDHGIDSAEGVTISLRVPTKGTIGGSFAEVSLPFCSWRCSIQFLEMNNTTDKLLLTLDRLAI